MLTLFILSYTLGAVVTYGASFGYLQNNWPGCAKRDYWYDVRTSARDGIIWPISIIVFLKVDGRIAFQSGLKFY